MRKLSPFLILSTILIICHTNVWSQVSSKVTNEDRYSAYLDSVKGTDYAYYLPFYGEKVRAAGYDLPRPAGVMAGFYIQRQDLEMENLSVGLGDELHDISDMVVFSKINTRTNAWTFRPDVWILPFMNIYAIFNRFTAYTDVVLSEPFELTIPQVTTEGYGGGFGTSLAYGWGPMWASANFNLAWSTAPNFTKPTQSFASSVRVGSHVWNKKRTRSISVWLGMGYQTYFGDAGGSYDLTQLIPDDLDLAEDLQEKIQEIRDGLNDRYEDFCSTPGNGPACAIMDPILEELNQRIEDKINGIDPPDELRINYAFNSTPAQKLNMLAGAQFTHKKRWDFRTEFGFIGRRSFMFNVNYRFGIKKRKTKDV